MRQQSDGENRTGVVERIGDRVFRVAVLLLPLRLRNQIDGELVSTFRARIREARGGSGRVGVFLVWLREVGDLVVSAIRIRRPDPWSERTSPTHRGAARPTSLRMLVKPPRFFEDALSDLRGGARAFARRPWLMCVAAATLALGIGTSTAMFSIVDAVLVRRLAYPDPDRLVSVYPTIPELRGHPTNGHLAERGYFSWPGFWAVYERQTCFDALAAYRSIVKTVSGTGRPERIAVGEANFELFTLLGAVPLHGRLFTAADDIRTGDKVVVLTDRYWRSRFGGNRTAVGMTLRLDDERYSVVGVLPPDFRVASLNVEAWIPRVGSSSDPGWGSHNVPVAIGRLGDGVTIERARQEVASILRQSAPPDHVEHGASVFPRLKDETRRAGPPLVILLTGAILLLAVACGNVAAMLLGAGVDRERELTIRFALGASTGRIARQLLVETASLTMVGAVLGVLLAGAVTHSLLALAPPGIPRIEDATLDGRVLAFAVMLSLACGMTAGLVPAIGLSVTGPNRAISASGGSTRTRFGFQAGIVAGEIAFATVLLAAACLLTRTLFSLNRVELGFDPEGLLTAQIATPFQRIRSESPGEYRAALDAYFDQLVAQVSAVPGVVNVAVTSNVPLTGTRDNDDVLPEGWKSEIDGSFNAERRHVSVGVFETLGIPLVEGRSFGEVDDHPNAAPTTIISRGLAEHAWPGESAIGKRIRYSEGEFTVIGVVGNVRDESLDAETAFAFYIPFRQVPPQTGRRLLIRTRGDMAGLAPVVRERIWSVNPNVPVTVVPMTALISDEVSQERYRARLMVAFALLAVLFALAGVYAVTARWVSRRTREFAILSAVGAKPEQIVWRVLAQGIRPAVAGALLGIVLSLVTGRFLETMLFGISTADPVSLASTALLVITASMLASLPPSRRATRVDAIEVLMSE